MSFKRHAYFLSLTLAGFILLFAVGLVSSFFADTNRALEINHLVDSGVLAVWRMVLYAMLLALWPRLITWIAGTTQRTKEHYRSRRPLLIVILLYEALIVFNPLALAISWVM